ncbi:MAG: hypothetical protein NZM65_03755 [Flavobacteriales bacterium]|nr:hypothetical protein [Flavobacteriales bacterium]MDW8409784.1 hypothetical protein [Flavobacteriales bacterium]
MLGHPGPVFDLISDGHFQKLFSAGSCGWIVQWEPVFGEDGRLIATVPSSVFVLRLIEGENYLLAGDSEGYLNLVNLKEASASRRILAHPRGVFSIWFSAGGNFILSGGADSSVALWEWPSMQLLQCWRLRGAGKIRSITAFPDSPFSDFAIAAGNGALYHLNVRREEIICLGQLHEGSLNAILFLSTHRLVSGGWDARLRLWDLHDRHLHLCCEVDAHNYAIYRLLYQNVRECSLLITASRDKTVKVWTEDLNLLQRLGMPATTEGHRRSVNALTAWGDGFVSAGDDGQVIVWGIE